MPRPAALRFDDASDDADAASEVEPMDDQGAAAAHADAADDGANPRVPGA